MSGEALSWRLWAFAHPPRQRAFLRDCPLEEIVSLLLARPGNLLPVDSGRAAPANARLLETVSHRLAALFSPGIPLDPGVLCRIFGAPGCRVPGSLVRWARARR